LQITDNAKQKIDGPCNANIASHLFLGKLLLLLLLRQLLQLAAAMRHSTRRPSQPSQQVVLSTDVNQ